MEGLNNENGMSLGKCRFCQSPLEHTFVHLGMSPLCEDFVRPHELKNMKPFYPLHVYVCSDCFLVQLEEFASPSEIYRDYLYFSSYSDLWLDHSKRYTNQVIERFGVTKNSLVCELASNDGYLLQYFLEKGIPVLGVEPAGNVAASALKKGIRTESKFFGEKTALELVQKYGQADLLIGNNVLAHVPDINDFVKAMKLFLKPEGIITMEFPHLLKLIEGNQFDTIYHEHFSYLSFTTVDKIFRHHGLVLFDVEELTTHGGSLRIYAKHQENKSNRPSHAVHDLLGKERDTGMCSLQYYNSFKRRTEETKWKILEFLINARREGKKVAGYGAPGKGNTLLNYCGISTDLIDYTVDRNPHKHGCYLPGSLIPIYHPDKIKETKPDYVFILPWNLSDEIMYSLGYISEWNGKFVVPIPELMIFETSPEMA
jgi:2-polyprenyl-3-methyl-5-hydroxy-6-metoxy-1,4-benzoquinol methylase